MERVIRTAATAAALLVIVLPISTRANEHLELWPLRGHLYVVEDDFYTKENSIVYVAAAGRRSLWAQLSYLIARCGRNAENGRM